MDHVVVRRLEHMTGNAHSPRLGYAVETRDRPGPAHKHGSYPGDDVWIQLHGGLLVAKARIVLGWVGEYSHIEEVRRRTQGSPIHDVVGFWGGRARFGYAAVAELSHERWVEPYWAGPRTYGYEWIVLEDAKKRSAWLDPKAPPRTNADLPARFQSWLAAR